MTISEVFTTGRRHPVSLPLVGNGAVMQGTGTVPSQKSFWNDWHVRKPESCSEDHHLNFLSKFANLLPTPQSSILELACGKGRDAAYYASKGLTVTALDFSETAIRSATSRYGNEGSVDFAVFDHSKPLPFPDDSFDGVVSYLGLHYFDDATTRSVFSEMRRVLYPNGHLQFLVKSTEDALYGLGDKVESDVYLLDGHLRHFFSRAYVDEIADATGFKIGSLESYSGFYLSQQPSSFLLGQLVAT